MGYQEDKRDDDCGNNDTVNSDSHPLQTNESPAPAGQQTSSDSYRIEPAANKGELLMDATACPQDISYPTDLNLLNDAREQSENLIDILYGKIKLADEQKTKPRTYVK